MERSTSGLPHSCFQEDVLRGLNRFVPDFYGLETLITSDMLKLRGPFFVYKKMKEDWDLDDSALGTSPYAFALFGVNFPIGDLFGFPGTYSITLKILLSSQLRQQIRNHGIGDLY